MSTEQSSESAVSRSQLIEEEKVAEEKEAPTKLSRMDFVKGAALGAGALAGVGTLASCAAPPGEVGPQGPAGPAGPAGAAGPSGTTEIEWDYETDVLVVGIGFAGLCAANRALDQDVDVTVIEKLPRGFWAPGGSFVISGQGVFQPPDKPYPQLVAAVGLETIKRCNLWLSDTGVELGGPTNVEGIPGGTVMPAKPYAQSSFIWRNLRPGGPYDAAQYGGATASLLLEERLIDGGAEILYETPANKLWTNEQGEVVGVRAKGKEGPVNIKAKATVLCTGGFSLNEEMVAKYVASPAREFVNASQCTPGATGDGLRMALEVGAAASGFGVIYAWMAPAVAAEEPFHDLGGYLKLDSLKAGVIVTDNGERYCDESLGRHVYGTLLVKRQAQQLRKIGFYIIDSALYQDLKATVDELVALGPEYDADLVYKADTIEELAQKAGIAGYLDNTLAEFNKAVDEGKTAQIRIPRTEPVSKIATPPFYAVPFVMGTNKSNGGPNIDSSTRVLNAEGEPIPGLYAAGEVTFNSAVKGVPFRPNHLRHISAGGGTGDLDNCLVFGVVAAEKAAEFAKG